MLTPLDTRKFDKIVKELQTLLEIVWSIPVMVLVYFYFILLILYIKKL